MLHHCSAFSGSGTPAALSTSSSNLSDQDEHGTYCTVSYCSNIMQSLGKFTHVGVDKGASRRSHVLPSICRNSLPCSVLMSLQVARSICPAGVSDFLAALPSHTSKTQHNHTAGAGFQPARNPSMHTRGGLAVLYKQIQRSRTSILVPPVFKF